MNTYVLKGLPEGITGLSKVKADSIEQVFCMYPALSEIRSKVTVDGNILRGFSACDG